MDLITVLAQADWTRALRFWLLIAAAVAAWESAHLFHAAIKVHAKKGGDRV
jgi:hypothetical protein